MRIELTVVDRDRPSDPLLSIESFDQLQDRHWMINIEVSCGLTKEEKLWLLSECHRQDGFLQFSAAMLIKSPAGELLDAREDI